MDGLDHAAFPLSGCVLYARVDTDRRGELGHDLMVHEGARRGSACRADGDLGVDLDVLTSSPLCTHRLAVCEGAEDLGDLDHFDASFGDRPSESLVELTTAHLPPAVLFVQVTPFKLFSLPEAPLAREADLASALDAVREAEALDDAGRSGYERLLGESASLAGEVKERDPSSPAREQPSYGCASGSTAQDHAVKCQGSLRGARHGPHDSPRGDAHVNRRSA